MDTDPAKLKILSINQDILNSILLLLEKPFYKFGVFAAVNHILYVLKDVRLILLR